MADCKEKSSTCVDCLDCKIQKTALWNAVNNAVIVIEYTEQMEEAIKTVIQEVSYAPEVHLLWQAYDEYKQAIAKWKKSHEILPSV
jgi:hypothetical protein